VLMALIDAGGSVVSKDALMARVWPNQVVEENNLEVQISGLRAIFGEERALIRTVARRGYQFTGEIHFPAKEGEARTSTGEKAVPASNLPHPVSELIGRDAQVVEVVSLAAEHRLVTLTGPGGIGKTRLALATAHRLLPRFGDGVWLADLAPLSEPGLVSAAVAAALGLNVAAGAITAERIAKALSGKRLLLLLDNCEHLIDAAATTAEALLRAVPSANVIATSREPLGAEGEHVYPVPALAVPAADGDDKTDPLEYGAVRLFLERARAAERHFRPDGRQIAIVVTICRRLDGIPLAIELAAARVAALSIEQLAARLDERFNLLSGGRRTALPRHQTLRAAIDWSHELLAEPERVLLRRLAIFVGPFSLDAASAVAAGPELAPWDAVEGLLSLVRKSLVVPEVRAAAARYRLLDTTRAYAIEKLEESNEREPIARRHAEYYRDLFEVAEEEWRDRPTGEWIADYGWRIDNLRAALDWAFSNHGDPAIGVALTTDAASLWMHLSLLEECRDRVERALAALSAGGGKDVRREMKLCAALGGSLLFTKGLVVEIELAWTRVLGIAEDLADREYQLRALWGLWVHSNHDGEFGTGWALAQRFRDLALARGDPTDLAIADRMIGVSLHYRGDQPGARHHIEHMLAHYIAPVRRSPSARFLYDQQAIAEVALARILWVQGFPDRAWSIMQRNIEVALASNNPTTLCFVLNEVACPIALSIGDLIAAERYVAKLIDHSAAHDLPMWGGWGRCFEGVLLILNGDSENGLRQLLSSLEESSDTDFRPRFTWFLGQLAEGFRRAGQISEGIIRINEAIARCGHNADGWCLAELLRIKGDLVLSASEPAATAENLFRQALDLAHRQGALSWELRTAMSLARLLGDQGRSADAFSCLQTVYDRYTEGFDTVDLKSARVLLGTLR
jgi:predicted ATPase